MVAHNPQCAMSLQSWIKHEWAYLKMGDFRPATANMSGRCHAVVAVNGGYAKY